MGVFSLKFVDAKFDYEDSRLRSKSCCRLSVFNIKTSVAHLSWPSGRIVNAVWNQIKSLVNTRVGYTCTFLSLKVCVKLLQLPFLDIVWKSVIAL